jgi:hypothetical protein
MNAQSLSKYDVVILCAGTYAGGISLNGYLKKHWDILKDKQVVYIAIGIAPADVEWSIRSYKKIPEQIRESIKYFKLPGKMGSLEVAPIKKENLAPVIEYTENLTP